MNYRYFLPILLALFISMSVSGQNSDSTKTSKEMKSEKKAEKRRKKEKNPDFPVQKENRYSKYSNIYNLLRAEFPEVQITGNTILIRGYTSLTQNSEPIFVVDGVITSTIEDIVPNRIKSIRILKGQSAAIYGMRGGNGVIEIVTVTSQGPK